MGYSKFCENRGPEFIYYVFVYWVFVLLPGVLFPSCLKLVALCLLDEVQNRISI